MTDGEGNKPAISLLEEQEQQKRRPAAPSQTPAPYVQPYIRSAVPPAARQVNLSGAGPVAAAEGSIRSHISNASYNQPRYNENETNNNGGSRHGGAIPGAGGSVASSLAEGIPGTINHAQLSHLLNYTQQQLTQLQQVQTLLLQHLQSLHQLQGAGSATSTGTITQTFPAGLLGQPSRVNAGTETATGSSNHAGRSDGPGAAVPGTSPTQINTITKSTSSAGYQATLPPPGRAPSQASVGGAGLAAAPRPPSRAGNAVLQPSPPRGGTSSPPAAWPPPRPPSQEPASLKEFSSLGTAACPGTPAPGSPESAGTSTASPPQQQLLQQSPPSAKQDTPNLQLGQSRLEPLNQAQPTSQQSQQQAAALAPLVQQQQLDASSCGSAPAAVHPGALPGGTPEPDACPALVPLDVGAGSEQSLASHPLAVAEPAAAAQPMKDSTSVNAVKVHSALAVNTQGMAAAAGDGSSPSQMSGATVTAPAAAVPAFGTSGKSAEPSPVGTLASPFATPVPVMSHAGAPVERRETRPLDVTSLSLGLQPLPQGVPPELVPPPSVMESALAASALTGPALLGLPGTATGLVLPHPLQPPLAQALPVAADPHGRVPISVFQLPSGIMPVVMEQHRAAAAAVAEAGAAAEAAARQVKEHASPEGSELAAQLDANRKDLMVFPEDDDDGDDEEVEAVTRKHWYKDSGVIWFFGSSFVGIVLLVTGLCLQLGKFNQAAADAEVFRWMYFVAGYVPIYWTVYLVVSRVFMVIEWIYFRENLTYLANIKTNATSLIAMLFQLLWFMACFAWLWCEKACNSVTYQRARDATWKAVLCIMLLTLANVIKAVTAKLSSMHFYRTAHFKKLKDSLEKEYYLQLLSVPRSRILAQLQAAADAHDVKHRIRTVLTRRSLFPVSHTLQRLSRPTPLTRRASASAAAAAGDETCGDTGSDGGAAAAKSEKLQSVADRGSGFGDGTAVNVSVSTGAKDANASWTASDGRDLARRSTAPARCRSWVGFWTCGSAPRRADSDNPDGHPEQPSSQTAFGHGGDADGGGRGVEAGPYAGSPPKWSSNFLAATSTVSSSPPGPGGLGAVQGGGSRGTVGGSVGVEHANGGGGGAPPPGNVTVVVMGDTQSARQPQLPPPPAAPPAPAPPPPPLPPQSLGSGGEPSLTGGGALGVVTAGPFLTQTSAFFDRSRGGRNTAQEQHREQQEMRGVQWPSSPAAATREGSRPAAPTADSGSGRAMLPTQLLRLVSRVFGGLVNSGSGRGREPASEPVQSAAAISPSRGKDDAAQAPPPLAKSRIRSSRESPPQRLKSTIADGGDNVAPQLHRRLAELGAEAFNVVPLNIKKKKKVHNMTEAELEKIRDAIVIKTYTALIRKHSGMSENEQLRELRTVKRFAKALYFNIRGPDNSKTYITLDDFKLFFGDDENMARKAFVVFDADKDGKLTRSEVRDRVVSIYAERRNMARSLRDTDSIVQSLELSLGIVIHFLFGAIYLTIWGVPLLEGFSAFSATVLALTFIFGNSAKNAFESVLFLFFEHPYDVGDMVYFNGDSMRVKRISLMYTDFVKWTNEEVYVPNTRMVSGDLTNWTRTRTKFELHKILVDVGVPWEVKEDISNALVAHCNAHPNDFVGVPRVTFREVVDPMKVYLGIGFTYNFPPDDFDRLVPARDKIMYVVQSKLAEHKLVFSNHQINRLEASEEIRMAMQMRQLGSLQDAGDNVLEDLLAPPRPQTGAAAGGDGGGAGTSGTVTVPEAAGGGLWATGGAPVAAPAPPGSWQPQPELLGPAGGAAGLGTATTTSALPAFGAEGLQQRSTPAAAAAAAAGAAAGAAGAADGSSAGDDQARKSKRD